MNSKNPFLSSLAKEKIRRSVNEAFQNEKFKEIDKRIVRGILEKRIYS